MTPDVVPGRTARKVSDHTSAKIKRKGYKAEDRRSPSRGRKQKGSEFFIRTLRDKLEAVQAEIVG